MKDLRTLAFWALCLPIINASAVERRANGTDYDGSFPLVSGAGGWEAALEKATAFVEQLTLEEKADMVTGAPGPCVGNIKPIRRLGFEGLCLQDGPLALRLTDYASVFPAGVTVASTWDRDLLYKRGYAMGAEFKAKGAHVALSPVAGPLGRSAHGGRNWEGFSSDPYLTGIAMEETIGGMQDAGTQATAKHFIGNEQETQRNPSTGDNGDWIEAVSANIDDRTLHELYLWPFANAVKAGTSALMCSYNRINSTYACQNDRTLNQVLKTELGFQGYVMSDWGGTHSGVNAIMAGEDMDMPGTENFFDYTSTFFGPNVTAAVTNSTIPQARLDDMIHRIMTPYYFLNQDADFPSVDPSCGTLGFFPMTDYNASDYNMAAPAHRDVRADHKDLIREIAGAATVLLKNTDNALPLKNVTELALFGSDMGEQINGPYAIGMDVHGPEYGNVAVGGGSGTGTFTSFVSPLHALTNKAFEDNFHLQYIQNNTQAIVGFELLSPQPEACVVFVKTYATEGYDRIDLKLDFQANELVESVASNCNNTIVVINAPGIVLMPWADHENVTAILHAHYAGEQSGNSVVDVLYGAVNPSGKLPYTVAFEESDYQFAPVLNVASDWNSTDPEVDYEEKLLIDYRYFDYYNKSVAFPFGFGLSYTTFELEGLSATKGNATVSTYPEKRDVLPGGNPALWDVLFTIEATVTNSGDVEGATVAQVYVTLPDTVPGMNAPLQLRGFEKVKLQAGESAQVSFDITRKDLSYWDVVAQDWKLESGEFTFSLAADVRDVKDTVTITI